MTDQLLTDHYGQSDLLASFERAIDEIGKTPETITAAELAPADEFHIGGRPATEHLLDQLQLPSTAHLLDVGCGIGGPARTAAGRYRRVSGIDLTPDYVQTGNTLNRWLGLDQQVDLRVGSALSLPFDDASFDGAYMIHVGMNIEDKSQLLAEIFRALKPGGAFGIYDIMQLAEGELGFPMPWSTEPSTSHVAPLEAYRAAATGAGFTVEAENNRVEAAMTALARLGGQAPTPLGLHLVMGPTVGAKVKNMVAAVSSGVAGPVELILRK